MFIETHTDNNVTLTFIQSDNVQVFPSGRRGVVISDNNKIPFDPEARLNTEANNRKQSGLSGYTQEYLKDWNQDARVLSLSLAGYLFGINLPEITLREGQESIALDTRLPNDFGRAVVAALDKGNDATAIYANILIEDVPLYSGEPKDYFTSILRNQSSSESYDEPEPSLDLQVNNSYYFSGLSFSTTPLTAKPYLEKEEDYSAKTRDNVPYFFERGTAQINQQLVSLRILEKSGDIWQIHEPARLPKIEHGATTDSIVVTGDALMKSKLDVKDTLTVDKLTKSTAVEVSDRTTTTNLTVGTEATIEKAVINTADIETAEIAALTGTDATIDTINSSDIQQKVDGVYRDVPVIFLEQVDGEYQLQITRINNLN